MVDFDKSKHTSTAEGYRDNARKLVIGYEAIYESIGAVLNIELSRTAEIMILGGGGGKELSSFNKLSDYWNFTVVDPSKQMLNLAEYWIEKHNLQDRTKLLNGYIEDFTFPESKFDAVTCVAVLHYLDKSQRLNIFQQVKKLLKPDGVFIWSVGVRPETNDEFDYLKKVYRQFPTQNGIENSMVDKMVEALDTDYKMISANEELEMLKSAGFKNRYEIFSSIFLKTYVTKN